MGCGFIWSNFETNDFPRGYISAGDSHSCALSVTGNVRCWGLGTSGRLGYGNTNNVGDGVGVSIAAAGNILAGGTVTQIAAGGSHTCALLSGGNVRCWGGGGSGVLGYGNTNNVGDGVGLSITAAGDVPIGGVATQITAGTSHTCALLSGGNVRCWGSGGNGRLGYGNTNNVGDGVGLSIIAAGDVPIGGTATQVFAYVAHTCAVLSNGSVRCWGGGASGRLGHDNTTDIADGIGPSIIAAGDVPVGGNVTQVSLGTSHTCALLTTGNVRCWGNGGSGRLGYGNTNSIGNGIGVSITTAGDVPVGSAVTQIYAGSNHTCALLTTGSVRCWGSGTLGRLGYGNTTNIGDGVGPSIIAAGNVPTGSAVFKIAAAQLHNCAVLSSGSMRCWGSGTNGMLGYGNTNNVGDGVGPSIISAGDLNIF